MDLYAGLISGTSMDAVDAALVDFGGDAIRIVATHSEPIPAPLHHRLDRVSRDPRAELEQLWSLDVEVGHLFADALLALLQGAGRAAGEVRGVGSHGQTVRHRPDASPPFSVQIGDPNVIVARSGITTVADFRRRDLALGGQGAPLAPAFHQALLGSAREHRAVVNLGGIANLTVLPPRGSGPVLGFDTGPGNTLLDAWARRHLNAPLDRDGRWAAGGGLDESLLSRLLDDAYFARSAPKSTGPELFNADWLAARLAEHPGDPCARDVQRTLVELTAASVSEAIRRHAPEARTVLLCGGGARNCFLAERIAARLPDRKVMDTGALGIDPDWVEAAAFAWLARRTLAADTGNLPEVTGARAAAILGGVYRA